MSALAAEYADWLIDHNTGQRKTIAHTPLPRAEGRWVVCFHEAAHAVVGLAYTMQLDHTGVVEWTDDQVRYHHTGRTRWVALDVPVVRFAVVCAAGECASLRYLRGSGDWSPEAAAAAVTGADGDRHHVITATAHTRHPIGRDHTPPGGSSWAQIAAIADTVIGHLWHPITAVATALHTQFQLSGDQVAALTYLSQSALTRETHSHTRGDL